MNIVDMYTQHYQEYYQMKKSLIPDYIPIEVTFNQNVIIGNIPDFKLVNITDCPREKKINCSHCEYFYSHVFTWTGVFVPHAHYFAFCLNPQKES
jgi:hypothetical protein